MQVSIFIEQSSKTSSHISMIWTCFTAVELPLQFSYMTLISIQSKLEDSENDICQAFGQIGISPRFSKIRLRSSPRFSNIRLKRVYRVLVRCITKTRQPFDWSPRYRVSPRFSKTPFSFRAKIF